MSHQTGAIFAAVFFQATELIKAFKQARPAQTIYKDVPTFHAGRASTTSTVNFTVNQDKWAALPSKCQYSGMAQNKKPMKENVENIATGYAMGSAECERAKRGKGRDDRGDEGDIRG
jgi:hypothetical protein